MFSKNIDFIHNTKSKTIFKIENFLDENLYNEIDNNFPTIDHNEISLSKNFGKKFFDNNDNFLLDTKKHSYLKKIDDIFFSKEFFDFFSKKFHKIIAISQGNFFRTLKYLRPSILSDGNTKITSIFRSKLKIRYDYSLIKNNGGIVPHVDGQRKYLSLMIYFPNKKFNDIGYGTTFWNCNDKNFNNLHIEDPKQIELFKKKNKPLYKSQFKKNCLFGFVRNNTSWHSVEPLDIDEKYLRRSININFYYEN